MIQISKSLLPVILIRMVMEPAYYTKWKTSLKPITYASEMLLPAEKKNALKSRRKHWELFLQLPNSIDSSMEDILF